MRNIVITLLFIFSYVGANAQLRSISGRVLDKKTGEPIVGAHVMVYPSQKITITNFDGGYQINQVGTEDSSIKVTMVGYQDAERTIPRNVEGPLDFSLEEASFLCSEVVVTGTRTLKTLDNTPIYTKVIKGEQLEAEGVTSVIDALQFAIPGVDFSRNPHNTSMQYKGLGNRYILILLDGQRMTGETLDQVNMSRINADDIEKIEVLNGAASSLYGSNAIGSVVNIITKKNKKQWQGSAGVRYSNENKDMLNDVMLGYKANKLDIRFNGFRRSSDGYDLTPEDEYQTEPGIVDYSAKLKAGYEISKNARIELRGRYFRNDNESGDPNVSGHKLKENYTYGIGLEFRPLSKHFVQINADSDESKQSYTNLGTAPDEVFAKNKFRTVSFVDTYTVNEDFQIIVGAEHNYESVFSETTFGPAPATKSVTDFNGFIQTDYKIVPSLDFVAGLRFTDHETFGSHYTPKFTLMQTVGNFKFRGNLSWGYKAPSLKHLYYNFFMGGMFWIYGNPDLEPETSFYNSLSVEYAKKDFNFSVSAYKNKLEDKIDGYMAIDRKTGKRAYYYKNYSAVRIRGVESYMQFRFFNDFTSRIGYNLTDAIDVETDRRMQGVSRHAATVGLTWNKKDLKYPISLNVSGRMNTGKISFEQANMGGTSPGNVNLTERTGKGYSIWKATYTQEFLLYDKFNLKVQLGVDNLMDYVPQVRTADGSLKADELFLNPGRTFWGALRIYL